MYLWHLSMQEGYNVYLILSSSITACTYLLLGCLLSDRYSNLLKGGYAFGIDFEGA